MREPGGEWLTFRELALATGITSKKLRYLRDTGVLADLGMMLYQVPCHVRSRWYVWVPLGVLCQSNLHSLPSTADYRQRNVSKT